jgi:hypothetical protein
MPENRSMSIWEQIALVQQWAPMIGYGQQILAEKDPYKKAIIVGDAFEWVATKSQTKIDDDVVKMITSLVETPQGEALIRYIVARVEGGA